MAKFCFYMSLIVSILLIIIGIVGLVKKKSISIFFLIAGMGIALFMLVDWGTSKK